jgi:dihydrofolate synthase/folylpolyglutamate synthase
MSYQKTLAYLDAQLPMYHRIGAPAYKANLDNTLALSKMLNYPEKKFSSVHIAGTNGKGSVAHMLASILECQGYRAGLLTSPHLRDFRERIRVNGKKAGISFVCSFIRKYKKDFERIKPSFFEMTVAMAFEYFKEQQVEIAVIETGLGGRLDSTNIIIPVLSVITNIGFDHMQFLGDTLEKIAGEKAGIIKKGIPVVIGETQEEVCSVFKEKVKKTKSTILFADQLFSLDKVHISGRRRHYQVMHVERNKELVIKNLLCPLLGDYQQKNIITVMGACEVLNQIGFPVSYANIRQGIRNVITNTELEGRWHIQSTLPLTIYDIGHNEPGIRVVADQLSRIPYRKLHVVFGVVQDKDLTAMLRWLPKKAYYYFCKADVPRGLDATELMLQAEQEGLKGKTYKSVKEALSEAQKNASPSDVIFVGGSTFVVAEII